MTSAETAAEVGRIDFAALPPVPEVGSAAAAAWWLALRHLGPGGNERFLSLVTSISILGVLVGVMVLNAVVAVMAGFETDLRDKILGSNAHIVVVRYGGEMPDDPTVAASAAEVDGVAHVTPFTYAECMIRSRTGMSGLVLKGVDPASLAEVDDVRDTVITGIGGPTETAAAQTAVFAALSQELPGELDSDEKLPGILLGGELAGELSVVAGDVVQLIDPVGRGGGPLGVPTPSYKSFRVAGLFHTGMYEYDTKWAYISLPSAQRFLKREGTVTGLEIRVDDPNGVEAISEALEARLGYPHYARHWRNLNQALFEALALEKKVMGLIFGMVVLVAGLLIVSNLYTMVLTKRREIAVLKAMGASRRAVMGIFLAVGGVIGLLGVGGGTIAGLLVCEGLDRYEYDLDTDVYLLSSLPVVVEPESVVVIAVAAFAVCILATIYPAFRAASVDPVEGLRYE